MPAETQGSSVTYHTLQMAKDLQDVGVRYLAARKKCSSVPAHGQYLNVLYSIVLDWYTPVSFGISLEV